tara:strand:- start:1183 stop:1356 length:174 start_codon:yes stop_codon:yes gene_type:complete
MIDTKEVEAKLKELQDNLQQRAETIVANDPICAEIRGNIASLDWVIGSNGNDKSAKN